MVFSEIFDSASFIMPSDTSVTAPFLLKDIPFSAKETEKAEISVVGLGLFELYINGKKVSDDIFTPAQSDYHEKDGKNSYGVSRRGVYRTYVTKYDISSFLTEKTNRLAVLLGVGWYASDGSHLEGIQPFGTVKMCCRIDITLKDGTSQVIFSDSSFKWTESFIKENDIFYGETQDLLSFDKSLLLPKSDISSLENTVETTTPESNYVFADYPPDRVIRTIVPTLVKDFGDYKVYDNGENISGYVRVCCDKKGETVVVRHTEELHDDKTLDPSSALAYSKPVNKQCDTYISDGESLLVPHFTYHGFRYFSVTSNAYPKETAVVHTDVKITSDFECSDETINWIYRSSVRTLLSNMHMCVPSDCPTRERLGYTGDGQLCAETAMHCLDAKNFYLKWLRDIADAQDINSGHVPNTAPFMGGGGGIGGWSGAIIELPYRMWKIYGLSDVIKEYLPNMMRFMSYMESRSSHGFVTCCEKGWNLGDWGFPTNTEHVPENFVNTYFYIKYLMQMVEICDFLGKKTDSEKYLEKANFSKDALRSAYKSPMSDSYCSNLSGANVFAEDLGMGTEKTHMETVKKYDAFGGFDTGIFATDLLIKTLFEYGNADTAVKLLSSHKERLSYGYMMDMGATSIWEYMHSWGSHNHPMFSCVVSCLFKYILGVRQTKDSHGYEKVIVNPADTSLLSYFKGSFNTVVGEFKVNCEKNSDGKIKFEITVPDKTEATFIFRNIKAPLQKGTNTFII